MNPAPLLWFLWCNFSFPASPPPVGSLSSDLTEFFSGEEARVLIEAKLAPGAQAPKLLREGRGHDKVVGVLNDSGVFGDRRAGDGVFSRKILFKEALAKTIRLHIEGNTETLALTVKPRPTLLEILGQIWSRFTHS